MITLKTYNLYLIDFSNMKAHQSNNNVPCSVSCPCAFEVGGCIEFFRQFFASPESIKAVCFESYKSLLK